MSVVGLGVEYDDEMEGEGYRPPEFRVGKGMGGGKNDTDRSSTEFTVTSKQTSNKQSDTFDTLPHNPTEREEIPRKKDDSDSLMRSGDDGGGNPAPPMDKPPDDWDEFEYGKHSFRNLATRCHFGAARRPARLCKKRL